MIGVAVLVGLLALPAIAWGGETASGSTETLRLEAPDERDVGRPMTIAVEGTADGLHRLFVYGGADWEEGCGTWPYQAQAQKGAVTLLSAEGEPLPAGHFFRSFVVTPTHPPAYAVCAYLDATQSANPDVFEYGCYSIPATPMNQINCYMGYVPWWVVVTAGKHSRELVEEAEAERKRREAEERRASEETHTRLTREEKERQAREAMAKRCKVPQLHRHSLAGARRLLRDAHCSLGRVTMHHGHGTPVVKSQNPQHGKTLPQGSPVSIVLGPRAG